MKLFDYERMPQGIGRKFDFNFSKNTSYGLGGLCKVAYFPETEEEAIRVFESLKEFNQKFFVLGCGSNVLASDKFFDGAIISTSKLKGIYRTECGITCLSGTTVAEVLDYCKKSGLSGLEFLAGIPASVGGITYMNAGAGGKFVSDVLKYCVVYNGNLHNLSNKLCNFGYKHSIMRDTDCIILSCLFKLTQSTPQQVSENINKYISARLAQPKGKSCGCVFKNPDGLSAGKLIEYCGLKGFAFGGARVSRDHANFIMNEGAQASDVYKLIKFVKKTVLQMTGVALEEEVVYIGDFNDSFS